MNASTRYNSASSAYPWAPRLWAFVLAAFAAGSAVYWVLKWPPSAAGSSAAAVAGQSTVIANPQAVARLLGAGSGSAAGSQTTGPQKPPAVSLLATRMALMGVVGTARQAGVALIAIDGKPARSFAVGSRVEGDLILQSVSKTRATLGAQLDSPALVTLELPIRK